MTIPACFLSPFAWKNLSLTLYPEVMSILDVEVFLGCSGRVDLVFTFILLVCVIFIGELSPGIFMGIVNFLLVPSVGVLDL